MDSIEHYDMRCGTHFIYMYELRYIPNYIQTLCSRVE